MSQFMDIVSTYVPGQDNRRFGERFEVSFRTTSILLPFLASKQIFFPLYMQYNANLILFLTSF